MGISTVPAATTLTSLAESMLGLNILFQNSEYYPQNSHQELNFIASSNLVQFAGTNSSKCSTNSMHYEAKNRN
jgi:hypothetical protein